VTGSSVLGVRYKGGIALAADTLASYGSLARFRTEERIKPLGNEILIGATGDLSDFQWVMKHLE
jgi:20S proteasome subunit beta 7